MLPIRRGVAPPRRAFESRPNTRAVPWKNPAGSCCSVCFTKPCLSLSASRQLSWMLNARTRPCVRSYAPAHRSKLPIEPNHGRSSEIDERTVHATSPPKAASMGARSWCRSGRAWSRVNVPVQGGQRRCRIRLCRPLASKGVGCASLTPGWPVYEIPSAHARPRYQGGRGRSTSGSEKPSERTSWRG